MRDVRYTIMEEFGDVISQGTPHDSWGRESDVDDQKRTVEAGAPRARRKFGTTKKPRAVEKSTFAHHTMGFILPAHLEQQQWGLSDIHISGYYILTLHTAKAPPTHKHTQTHKGIYMKKLNYSRLRNSKFTATPQHPRRCYDNGKRLWRPAARALPGGGRWRILT